MPDAFNIADQIESTLLGCSYDWLPNLSEEFIKREIKLFNLKDISDIKSKYFIKPALSKSFNACVTTGERLHKEVKHLPEMLKVHVSEPVTWEVEYRCFISEKEIKTLSPYVRYKETFNSYEKPLLGPASERTEAFIFAQNLVEKVNIPNALVLDIGKIKNKGWAVVEPNECWGSGIYGCSPKKVLQVLLNSCIPKKDFKEDQKCWDYKVHYFDACPNLKND